MSITTLKLTGFKSLVGHSFSFDPAKNIIKARNGKGKSSLADAMAFVYCGTDRYGNARPVHLINKDMDSCKVEVTSDKGSTLSRTLSKKGNGTIKAIRNDVPNTLTQTQLSGLIGPQDVFLSATMLGYFMTLTPSKRKEVLNQVLPKPDPYQLVLQETGVDVKGRYVLEKKSAKDLIAQDRRAAERRVSEIEGELNALRGQSLPEKPEVNPSVYEIKDEYEKKAEAWQLYNKNKEAYKNTEIKRNQALARYQEIDKEIKEMQKELEGLSLKEEIAVVDVSVEVSKLLDGKLPIPVKPTLQKEINAERCPTCGTPVSKKMLTTVRETNKKLQEEYEAALKTVEETNAGIQEKVQALRAEQAENNKKVKEVRDYNAKVENRKATLTSKISYAKYPEIPELPEEPVAPEGSLDEQSYKHACQAIKDYDKALAVYEHALANHNGKADKVTELQNKQAEVGKGVEELIKVEAVVKNLPNIILDSNKSHLAVPGMDVAFVDGDIAITWNGVPYKALSTGQKMRVDFAFCEKINGFMERPVNLFFVDDSDLIDTQLVPSNTAQMFYTLVDANEEEVKVIHG